MFNRPVQAYIWIKVLSVLKADSLEEGCMIFSRQFQKGNISPWTYFFDILCDPRSRFCFLKNDRQFQENVIAFIERNIVGIPNYLVKRFRHVLSNEEDVEKLKTCVGESRDEMSKTRSSDSETVSEINKRRLSSPVLPDSKHVCLEKSPTSDIPNIDHQTVIKSPVRKSQTSNITDFQTTKKDIVIESVSFESESGKNTESKLLPINRLLELDNQDLVLHLSLFSHDGYDHTEASHVSYEHLKTILDRIKNSSTALQKFICLVVVPSIASKKVCNRYDSAFLSECFGLEYLDHVRFVMEILRKCNKQIIDGTAKIVITKPALSDEIMCGLVDLKFWTEDVTGFLASIVNEKCSVSAVQHVMQYLIKCSDEKSSKSCTLVMRILVSHGKNESILKLCTEFAEQSKSFLKKALLQKLDSFLD